MHQVRQAAVCNSIDTLFRRHASVQRQFLAGLIPETRARRQMKLLRGRMDQVLKASEPISPRQARLYAKRSGRM